MSTRFAFVTLLTSDSYLPGVLAVFGALKNVHLAEPQAIKYETVCMVTPETLDVTTIKLLRKACDVVIGVEAIDQPDPAGLFLLGRPDLDAVLTKIHVFRLTQYSKIIFLDADVLPLRPLSHLFHLQYEFSAVPDVGWPDIFNSGVMVLSPAEDSFNQLRELLKTNASWDGGDQGLLNEWRGGNWNRLSFTYNTTPTAAYTYAPAYERFGSEISVVHFIGPHKPWHSIPYRASASFTTQSSSNMHNQYQHSEPPNKKPQLAYDYGSLVDRWYSIFDQHYRSKPTTPNPGVPVSKYASTSETKISPVVESAGASGGGPLSLDVLRRFALREMGVMSFSPSDQSHGDGEYKSMPLEGRVGLMRPSPVEHRRVVDHNPNSSATELDDPKPSEEVPEPTTPVQQMLSLPWDASMRWNTLPTPNSDEVPPAPHTRLLSLPPTPAYCLPPPHRPIVHGNQQTSPLSLQERRIERSRPNSPPLLSWNAALESPPKDFSAPSAPPSNAYFHNVWHDSISSSRARASSSWSTSSMSSETDATSTEVSPMHTNPSPQALFNPPPVPEIPRMLLQLGHYCNVTGPAAEGGALPPTPDRAKVKRVFPWEERPRASPARVFPENEAHPSGLMSLQPSPRSAALATTPVRLMSRDYGMHQPMPSPLAGFPSLTSGNIWDAVPGIQKFASKLAHPPGPSPLSPAFESMPRKSWEEKSEASSHDGDVEDEVESDEEEGRQTVTKARSRSSSILTTKKSYRAFGVQTDAKELRSQGVQVGAEEEDTIIRRSSKKIRTLGSSMDKQWQPSSSLKLLPVVDVVAGAEPTGLLSPGTQQSSTLQSSSFVSTEGLKVIAPLAMAGSLGTDPPPQTSGQPDQPTPGETGTAGPYSSRSRRHSGGSPTLPATSPVAPGEGQSASALRRASRIWDPTRGVELFKRGSEEVLARFLKISSR